MCRSADCKPEEARAPGRRLFRRSGRSRNWSCRAAARLALRRRVNRAGRTTARRKSARRSRYASRSDRVDSAYVSGLAAQTGVAVYQLSLVQAEAVWIGVLGRELNLVEH